MEDTAKTKFIDIAEAMISLAEEFLVVPLDGKSPHLVGKGWISQGSRDPVTLRDWARKWPNANVGIVATDHNWHIDVDMSIEEFFRIAPDSLPGLKTLMVRSGGEKGGMQSHIGSSAKT